MRGIRICFVKGSKVSLFRQLATNISQWLKAQRIAKPSVSAECQFNLKSMLTYNVDYRGACGTVTTVEHSPHQHPQVTFARASQRL